MDIKQKAPIKRSGRKPKTHRVKRGLHEITEYYVGLNGFNTSIVGSNTSTTYGEISMAGLQPLAETFKRYAPLIQFDKLHRNFIDLGSGTGKVVIGMAILVPEIQSNGIELIHERHNMAITARQKITTGSLINRIHFLHGNFVDPPYVFKNACWIFVSNLSFSNDLQTSLARSLEAGCSPKSVIICLKELPLNPTIMECMDRGIIIPMSWSSISTCYVYRYVSKLATP